MPEHARTEMTVFSRELLAELAKFAAKERLIGQMYIGDIGEQTVRWLPDGSVEVITPHTPGAWKDLEKLPKVRKKA